MNFPRQTRLCGLALLAVATAACGGYDDLVWPDANIILISIDTLRADRLGAYGYERKTSPQLDALAENAWVFRDAYTHSPNTIVSHASLLTSLHPDTHGVRPDVPLAEDIESLAEYLRRAGYRTGGFTTHGAWLNHAMGFAQGFQEFASAWISGPAVNLRVMRWLRKTQSDRRPLFLFVHYFDVHSKAGDGLPYKTGTAFDRKFVSRSAAAFTGCRKRVCGALLLAEANAGGLQLDASEVGFYSDLYDGGVGFVDQQVGSLLNSLRELGFFDSSWIVITADHGEEFLEHGELLHRQPYQEVAHIPLIIKPPHGTHGRPVHGIASLIDVMPTLLEGVGIQANNLQGRSLLPRLRAPDQQEELDAGTFFAAYERSDDITLRTQRYTLITREGFSKLELYDRLADPSDRLDVASGHPEQVQQMLASVRAFHREQASLAEQERETVEVDEQTAERLRQLGYSD